MISGKETPLYPTFATQIRPSCSRKPVVGGCPVLGRELPLTNDDRRPLRTFLPADEGWTVDKAGNQSPTREQYFSLALAQRMLCRLEIFHLTKLLMQVKFPLRGPRNLVL